MRRRRVDRCVLRAAVAVDAGNLEDARAALEEVERLDPSEPAIEPLRSRLATAELKPAESPPDPPAIVSPPVERAVRNPAIPDTPPERIPADTPVPEAAFLKIPETSPRTFPASAAAVLIAISGAAGWFLFSQNAPGEPPVPRTDAAVVYDAKPAIEQPTPPSQPAVAEPDVQLAETAVTAPVTSEPIDAPTTPAPTEGVGETAPDTPSVETPRAAPPPAVVTSSNTSTMASAAPPSRPPSERRALPASFDPSPSLPDPAPAVATPVPPSTVHAVTGTEGVALSGTSVTLTPPAAPPTPAPMSTPVPTSSTPAAASSSASASVQADESQVRAVLRRYEAAYSSLDAAAASAVWPGVDRRALASAFQSLSSQSVSLGRCEVRVAGATAQAECRGNARWQPKVGAGPQTAARYWQFDLRNTGSDWIISRATVR